MSVRIDREGPVTTVTIDRPEVRNAVDRPTAEDLADAFRAFDADDDASVATGSRRPVTHRWVPAGCGCPSR